MKFYLKVTPLQLLLFGSEKIETVPHEQSIICLDNWINLKMEPGLAAIIVAHRQAMDSVLVDCTMQPSLIESRPPNITKFINTLLMLSDQNNSHINCKRDLTTANTISSVDGSIEPIQKKLNSGANYVSSLHNNNNSSYAHSGNSNNNREGYIQVGNNRGAYRPGNGGFGGGTGGFRGGTGGFRGGNGGFRGFRGGNGGFRGGNGGFGGFRGGNGGFRGGNGGFGSGNGGFRGGNGGFRGGFGNDNNRGRGGSFSAGNAGGNYCQSGQGGGGDAGYRQEFP
jgi:ATP-dependent RNA helicase A